MVKPEGKEPVVQDASSSQVDPERTAKLSKVGQSESAGLPGVFEISAAVAALAGLFVGIIITNNVDSLVTPLLTLVVVLSLCFPFWWSFPKRSITRRLPKITIRVILGFVLVLAVAGCAYWEYYLLYRVPVAAEISRRLVPAGDPYIQDECAENVPSGALLIYFGTSTAYIPPNPESSDTSSVESLLLTANMPALAVEKASLGIYLSANVMSKNGQSVGRIDRNKFVNSPDNSWYQVRPDRSTFAVYDEHGEEVFYVRYVNSYAIKIRGVFGYPGKHSIVITEGEMFVAALNQHIPKMCIGPIAGGYRF